MQFNALHDPIDVARAYAALDGAFRRIKSNVEIHDDASTRRRLASLIVSLMPLCEDEDDLINRTVRKYLASEQGRGHFRNPARRAASTSPPHHGFA